MPPTRVVRNDPNGIGLRRLIFDRVLSEVLPGQYVLAEIPGERPAMFAVASSPGEPLELLVKAHGPVAEAIAAAVPGDAVELSDPRGPGFPLGRSAGRPLVLLVNGSGMSAARPVVRAEIADGMRRPVHLFYGVMTPDHRAYAGELAHWEAAGVHVHTVVDSSCPQSFTGARGFVQDHAAAMGLLDPDVTLVLVGVPMMIEDVRKRYAAAGGAPEHVLVNF